MANIPLSKVEGGGGGVALGDYVQSEASATADGKVLLDLDNSLLNAVTYPELAAIFKPKYLAGDVKTLASATSTAVSMQHTGIGEDTIFSTLISASTPLTATPVSNDSRSSLTLYNFPVNRYQFGVTCSLDGQYIFALSFDNTTRLYITKSDDFGATFTESAAFNLSVSVLPTAGSTGAYDLASNADSSLLRLAYPSSTGFYKFYESTDFGVSWVEIWIGLVPVEATQTQMGRWSGDLSTFAVVYYQNASITNVAVKDGVYYNLDSFPLIFGNNTYTTTSYDGSRIVVIRPVPSFSRSQFNDYWYTDDFGVTWEHKQLLGFKATYNALGADAQTYKFITFTPLVVSQVNKDYGYMMMGLNVSNNENLARLMRVHIPTGHYVVLTTVTSNTTGGIIDMSQVSLKIRLLGDGVSERIAMANISSISECYTFKYGQYLMPPSEDLGSNLQNLPTKIVADRS